MKFRVNSADTQRADRRTSLVGGAGLSQENVLKRKTFAGLRREQQPSRLVEYVVDAESKLVSVKFGKKLTFGDIERYAKRLQLNPSFRLGHAEKH